MKYLDTISTILYHFKYVRLALYRSRLPPPSRLDPVVFVIGAHAYCII
jgi:hypothetical protein